MLIQTKSKKAGISNMKNQSAMKEFILEEIMGLREYKCLSNQDCIEENIGVWFALIIDNLDKISIDIIEDLNTIKRVIERNLFAFNTKVNISKSKSKLEPEDIDYLEFETFYNSLSKELINYMDYISEYKEVRDDKLNEEFFRCAKNLYRNIANYNIAFMDTPFREDEFMDAVKKASSNFTYIFNDMLEASFNTIEKSTDSNELNIATILLLNAQVFITFVDIILERENKVERYKLKSGEVLNLDKLVALPEDFYFTNFKEKYEEKYIDEDCMPF